MATYTKFCTYENIPLYGSSQTGLFVRFPLSHCLGSLHCKVMSVNEPICKPIKRPHYISQWSKFPIIFDCKYLVFSKLLWSSGTQLVLGVVSRDLVGPGWCCQGILCCGTQGLNWFIVC